MKSLEPLIVYIIGDNRSGSTLLDYLISSHPDGFSAGELHHIHGYYNKIGVGKRTDWKCSCGNFIQECPFWNEILEEAAITANSETRLERQELWWTFLFRQSHEKALDELLSDKAFEEKGKAVSDNCWRIYKTIMNKTGKRIIVDSSKNPFEAFYRNKYKQGNIKFLLLERDIRAIAYSNRMRTEQLTSEVKSFLEIKERSIYKNLLLAYKVLLRNRLIAKRIQKLSTTEDVIMKVNYTDLASNPEEIMKRISSFLNVNYFAPPLLTNEYSYTPHILGGSPSRYTKRAITPDNRWQAYYKKKIGANFMGHFLNFLIDR